MSVLQREQPVHLLPTIFLAIQWGQLNLSVTRIQTCFPKKHLPKRKISKVPLRMVQHSPPQRDTIRAVIWQISQALHKSHKPVLCILVCIHGTVAWTEVLALAIPPSTSQVSANVGFWPEMLKALKWESKVVFSGWKILSAKKRRRMFRIQQFISFYHKLKYCHQPVLSEGNTDFQFPLIILMIKL